MNFYNYIHGYITKDIYLPSFFLALLKVFSIYKDSFLHVTKSRN